MYNEHYNILYIYTQAIDNKNYIFLHVMSRAWCYNNPKIKMLFNDVNNLS